MRLFIAEKPSLARAIGDTLPGTVKKSDGYLQLSSGDIVTWCIGHLLEQAQPEAYKPEYKSWRLEHLPIIPKPWKIEPKAKTRKQVTVIKKLIAKASCIIHAGDPDREGQLLVDQVINYCLTKKAHSLNIQRLLIADLNQSAIKKSLNQIQDNRNFAALSISALARARADWLYGINMTRAMSLHGQRSGFKGVLSVGRVQTPVLALVVERDQHIRNFTSKPFYQVSANLTGSSTSKTIVLEPLWQPSKACSAYQDDQGRVLSKALAENVIGRIHQKDAIVEACQSKTHKVAPPLPYSLSSLQIDAAKRFRMSAQQVLDTCQSLYEKYQLITYPRSDCRYLPTDHWQQATQIIGVTKANTATINNDKDSLKQNYFNQADPTLKSKAFNNAKVGAHHAIIPTTRSMDLNKLSNSEKNIYQTIVRQYLTQFFSEAQEQKNTIDVRIAGGLFRSKHQTLTQAGWKVLFPRRKVQEADTKAPPTFNRGDLLFCQGGKLIEKSTTPPEPYNDATLLAAMTNIARFVEDPSLKKTLKDTDGIGTEATRAGIIELLFKRQFLVRSGRVIQASEAGTALINTLPRACTQADMTARWEKQLEAISHKTLSYDDFINPLIDDLRHLLNQAPKSSWEKFKHITINSPKKRKPYPKKRNRA